MTPVWTTLENNRSVWTLNFDVQWRKPSAKRSLKIPGKALKATPGITSWKISYVNTCLTYLTGFLWIFCWGGQALIVARNLEKLLLWLWNHLTIVTCLSGQLLLDSHRNTFIASQLAVQELEVKLFLFSCLPHPYWPLLTISWHSFIHILNSRTCYLAHICLRPFAHTHTHTPLIVIEDEKEVCARQLSSESLCLLQTFHLRWY